MTSQLRSRRSPGQLIPSAVLFIVLTLSVLALPILAQVPAAGLIGQAPTPAPVPSHVLRLDPGLTP